MMLLPIERAGRVSCLAGTVSQILLPFHRSTFSDSRALVKAFVHGLWKPAVQETFSVSHLPYYY